MIQILSLILLTPAALAQMDSVRPDVSYTGNNDRFDVSRIASAHNKMFRNTPLVDDDEGDGADADYRRQLHHENARILLDALTKKHAPHALQTRRDDDEIIDGDKFAEDDTMNSFEGGTVSDFEDSLKNFQMSNVKPPSRRKLHDEELAENEILLQNVVPIVMTVDGYLKPPLK